MDRLTLFEASTADALVLGGATAIVLIVAAIASAVPSRAAARIDPVNVLRQ